MTRQRTLEGGKNLISKQLRELREEHNLSIRGLSDELKKLGYEIDRNVICRIENDERYVTDVEVKAFVEVFNVDYAYLIEGKKKNA